MNRRDAETQRAREAKDRITESTELRSQGRCSADSVILSSSAPSRLCGENHWLLWQLADSAFPTGGFAHSGGLEAAWQQGEVRNRDDLREWLLSSLLQVSRAALPFVNVAHAEPERLEELDRLCDAFTSNHVANRASRAQGRALLSAVERIFPERRSPTRRVDAEQLDHAGLETGARQPPFAHFAPVFGVVTRRLGVTHDTSVRLLAFTHLRGVIAAAVRLNIVGPMEGQGIQFQLSGPAEAVALHGATLTLEELAQTAPLLDLWQGTQDRLYSRLFQS